MNSQRKIPKVIVAIAVGCLIFPFAMSQWAKYRKPPVPQNFRFPTAELAALDRDLQARFAVVPEKDFGIERTYGNQHYLYDPNTPKELQTVQALKKQNTQTAFYLMSRALWLKHWDGAYYKPIQGPVVITSPIKGPLPRKTNFEPLDRRTDRPIMRQPKDVPYHKPSGTPVPAPTFPPGAPKFNKLQELGNQVFEMAENAPPTAKVGLKTTIKSWQVVAVPIRASSKACLPCHVYNPQAALKTPPGKTKVEVGDALGVAFYAYRKLPPAQQTRAATQQTKTSRVPSKNGS